MSIFPTKILLATDGSQDAELAATTAVNLAKSTNSELHVLTVGPGSPAYDLRSPEVVEELQKQKQNVLEEQVKRIEQAGGEVTQRHLRLAEHHPGSEHYPSDDVVRVAEEIGAGLIVLGSRGLGGVRRALMGSVSDSVVRHAHCPVMVVRGEPVAFPTRILLATDGSKEAELAATAAAELAKSTAAELQVAHVAAHSPSYARAAGEELPDVAQQVLDEQVDRLQQAGVTVAEAHVRVGPPAAVIVALAEHMGAQLIIMGSRGMGGIRRALMGSVSDSVVRHAHCAVMVVRE